MYNKELYKTLKQWELDDIEILKGKETHLCELCNSRHVRFVYVMKHKYSDRVVRVGCDCAIHLKYGNEDEELISECRKEYKKKEKDLIKLVKQEEIEEAKVKELEDYKIYLMEICSHPFVKDMNLWPKEAPKRIYLSNRYKDKKITIYLLYNLKKDKRIFIKTDYSEKELIQKYDYFEDFYNNYKSFIIFN